ncbi:hypothetical protein SLEP1_g6183 [Rubroshorea leprosula]|uniref:Uncharacterized protein n=1 Tax=Rubroshorea leprosula TaxID=152421 RepID=A0AAV5I2I5_9ROSI|nr:hypothetical protein SLEP1_g6183 [Rubroshorea leprosula]
MCAATTRIRAHTGHGVPLVVLHFPESLFLSKRSRDCSAAADACCDARIILYFDVRLEKPAS